MDTAMTKLKFTDGGGHASFYCPGCKDYHTVAVSVTQSPAKWGYNGDPEKPTFTPSILVRGGHYAPSFKPGDRCWCIYNAEKRAKGEPEAFACNTCHSFVTAGRIQFLADSTHHLAGQTVDLPDLDDPNVHST